MNVVFSLILLAAALGCIVFLLTRRENARRSQYGPSGLSEFRTDLPLDDCFDRLDQHSPDDEFAYECRFPAPSDPAPAYPAAAGHPVYPPA